MVLLSTSTHKGHFRHLYGSLESPIQAMLMKSRGLLCELGSPWKQFWTSRDHDGMIVQENRGIELIMEHFTLHPIDFALPQQAMRNFVPLLYLTPFVLDFALPLVGSAKFRTPT